MTTLGKLEYIANRIRQDIIQMLLAAGSGHSAGPLGMVEVFTALYFAVLRHRPHQPDWMDRDRVILSNGHICPVWYATLAAAGYLPHAELRTLRKLGSRLQGHPHRGAVPGIMNSSGPLGQGLSTAVGVALAGRMNSARWRTFALLSDAEHQEGQTWEAAMFAADRRLTNLTAIVDRNNIQIDGPTEQVLPLEPLKAKWEAFGWHVLEVDGQSIPAIVAACQEANAIGEQPVVILAHTIPGKGVDFMERDYRWHGVPPNAAQAAEALAQLRRIRSLDGRIHGEHE